MTFEKFLICSIVLFYSLATLGVFIGMLSSYRRVKIGAHYLTLLGFVFHTVLACVILLRHSMAEISAGQYLLLLPWCLIAFYLFAWRLFKSSFVSLTAAPLALIVSIFSVRLSDIQIVLPQHLSGPFMGIHLSTLFISFGLLTMACGAGIIFLYVNSKIKKKAPIGSFATDFPALSTCDKINHMAVLYGFPCYTLGLISGFIWAPLVRETVQNPKILTCLVLWFFYALLFYQRVALGIKGKRPSKLAIIIFVIAIVALGLDQVFTHHSQILLPI